MIRVQKYNERNSTIRALQDAPPHIPPLGPALFAPHCPVAPPGPALDGTPVHTFELSPTSSSSPHVPPMLEVGVCPHGVFWVCDGGGCPPLRRFASHKSVPTKQQKTETVMTSKHCQSTKSPTFWGGGHHHTRLDSSRS